MALDAKILYKKKGIEINLDLNHNKYEELNFAAA